MPRKTALVIGNSAYQDPALAQLKAPDADVRGLTDLLRHVDVGQFDEVVPLVNATEAKTRVAIATFFARARPDDMLLLYFSGHGVLDDKGRLYLAATDTQRDLPQATAISAAFVTDAMDSSPSRRQVLILDCCHSGAFARGARGVAEAKAITAATFEGAGYGRAVLTATDATQYAWEGEAVMGSAENSVFTHCMIEGLRTGAADTDQDGEITLEELYTYIYGEVVKRTPKQTPRKWSYNQEGEFVIARNPHPLPPPPAPLPDDLQHSVDDLRPWVREGALLELERLLFGSTPVLAAAAHTALLKLKDDDSRRISVTATNLLARYDAARQAEEAAREAAQQARRAEQDAAREQAEREQQAQAALAEQQRLEREEQAKAEREQQAQAALAEQQRLEREQQAKAEQEKQAQAALAEQQRVEREQQAKAEQEKQAQAALAEQQRLEREAQAKAKQEKRAQAALAEQQRLEREQQVIADREKKIQARLAERQRLEREKAAQAALAARAQPASAPAAPSAPPKAPAPSAADSTSPLPAVHPPTKPPPAAAAATTGGLGQLLAAPWMPVVIMAVGWALSRGLAQAIFSDDHYPERLPWLINWLVGGAAGGYLTGLALERATPGWQRRHSWQAAAAWSAAWGFGYVCIQALRQYASDADIGLSYDVLDLPMTLTIGALGGYLLGIVWRGARPAVTGRDIAALTGGWAVAWLVGNLLANVWRWTVGGLLGGLIGGAVTLYVASHVRRRPDPPAGQPHPAGQRALTRRDRVWAGAIIALGWGLGWLAGIGSVATLEYNGYLRYVSGFERLTELLFSAVTGVIGGWLTVLALRRALPALSSPPARRSVAVWAASLPFSTALAMVTWSVMDENGLKVDDYLASAFGLAVAGALGGYYLALVWQRAFSPLSAAARLQIAGGWAAAFGLSYLVLKLVLQGIFGPGLMGWAVAGLIAGGLGAAAMLWPGTRSEQSPSR